MNRDELKNRISNLPLFEKRTVQVNNHESEECTIQQHKAITEINGKEAYAYVHPSYELVQFKDVFLPILNQINEEIDGYVSMWKGYAFMKLFPQNRELQEGNTQYGIMCSNSVDLSSSVIIGFVVRQDDTYFVIPQKISGFKKKHAKDVDKALKNYTVLLTSVKNHWKTIITKLNKFVLKDAPQPNEDALKIMDVLEQLKIGKHLKKEILKKYQEITLDKNTFTLWDLFITAINLVSEKKTKSEVHKERKIENICNTVITYANILQL